MKMEQVYQQLNKIVPEDKKTKYLKMYQGEKEKLVAYSDEELKAFYFELKASYEKKKLIFTLFFVVVILGVFTNVLKGGFDFWTQVFAFQYVSNIDSKEIKMMAFLISAFIMFMIIVMIVVIVKTQVNTLKDMYKKILIIEEEQKRRAKESDEKI